MQRDYYALKQEKLGVSLVALEEAAEALKHAKQRGRGGARGQAECRIRQAAEQAVEIEPHLASLWLEARRSGPDKPVRDAWQKRLAVGDVQQDYEGHLDFCELPDIFRFVPNTSKSSFVDLPLLSFLLRIPFQLHAPYLSKDERNFYLLDSPLRREKVFQTPMIAPTSWKGALRAALWQLGYTENCEVTVRLLGNPRASQEQQAGRLHFFATFFDKVDLEVINPHDRKFGVGMRGPILMECVPAYEDGELVLLYVPFGPTRQSENCLRSEVAEDLEIVARGVQAMLTTYGFGAKISSGFGTARDRLVGRGTLAIRAELTARVPPTEDTEIIGPWELEARESAQGSPYKTQTGPIPSEAPSVSKCTFRTLSELCDISQRLARELREGTIS